MRRDPPYKAVDQWVGGIDRQQAGSYGKRLIGSGAEQILLKSSDLSFVAPMPSLLQSRRVDVAIYIHRGSARWIDEA